MQGPVNGGRNSDGPKVNSFTLIPNFLVDIASLSKTKPYAGNSSKTLYYSLNTFFFSKNVQDTGTISRKEY